MYFVIALKHPWDLEQKCLQRPGSHLWWILPLHTMPCSSPWWIQHLPSSVKKNLAHKKIGHVHVTRLSMSFFSSVPLMHHRYSGPTLVDVLFAFCVQSQATNTPKTGPNWFHPVAKMCPAEWVPPSLLCHVLEGHGHGSWAGEFGYLTALRHSLPHQLYMAAVRRALTDPPNYVCQLS